MRKKTENQFLNNFLTILKIISRKNQFQKVKRTKNCTKFQCWSFSLKISFAFLAHHVKTSPHTQFLFYQEFYLNANPWNISKLVAFRWWETALYDFLFLGSLSWLQFWISIDLRDFNNSRPLFVKLKWFDFEINNKTAKLKF